MPWSVHAIGTAPHLPGATTLTHLTRRYQRILTIMTMSVPCMSASACVPTAAAAARGLTAAKSRAFAGALPLPATLGARRAVTGRSGGSRHRQQAGERRDTDNACTNTPPCLLNCRMHAHLNTLKNALSLSIRCILPLLSSASRFTRARAREARTTRPSTRT